MITWGVASTNLLLQMQATLRIESARAEKDPEWLEGIEQIGVFRPFLPEGWSIAGNPGEEMLQRTNAPTHQRTNWASSMYNFCDESRLGAYIISSYIHSS